LLGIKVIKLNKIRGTRTIGANLLAARNRRELSFQSSKLPATGSNQKLSNLSLHRRQLPNRQKALLKTTAKKSACA